MSVKLVISGQAMHYNQHYLLDGLDLKDQHPIEAIIGLRDELSRRYILPVGGIPAGDLAEKYVSIDMLEKAELAFQTMYMKVQSDVDLNKTNISINTGDISVNTTDIFNLTSLLDGLKNKINNMPGSDESLFNSGVCIKQVSFEATDIIKYTDIVIKDTDLKVIEPTILNSTGGLLKNGIDYSVSYQNDITLRITFVNNGIYKINYISGEVTDSEFNILLDYYKKLESKVAMNTNGSILYPAHDMQLIYDDLGKIIKEIYTGNINKIVDYRYDANDNIIKKIVTQDNIIKTANYMYDSVTNKLVTIQDDGTDIPVDGAKAKAFGCTYEYDIDGFVIKETYTGDINKVVTYEHNNYGDITKKIIVENGITKTAVYTFDDSRKLIKVDDDGTEGVAIVFPEYTGGSGSGNTPIDIGIITNAEIDLIFETIFND